MPTRMVNKSVVRGTQTDLIFYALGDHTERKLTFGLKANKTIGSTIYVQKKNEVNGGSDDEIETVLLADYSPTTTKITIHLEAADTATLTKSRYYFDIDSEDETESEDIDTPITGVVKLKFDVLNVADSLVSTGDTVVLTPKKAVVWVSVNGVITRMWKVGFSGNVTAAFSGDSDPNNEITITSDAGELNYFGSVDSNIQIDTIAQNSTSEIVFTLDDPEGDGFGNETFSFWWQDPTQVNLSVNAETSTPVGTTTNQVRTGTTAQRLAYGATLTTSDSVVWIDTDEGSPFFWDGSKWI